MKKPSQFLPMLRQMLGLYRRGPLPLLFWFVAWGCILYLAANPPIEPYSERQIQGLGEAFIPMCCSLWLYLMVIATPVPFLILAGPTPLEYLFTRALDRGIWLRAERMAVIILVVVPLLVNLALSPLRTDPRHGAEVFAAWLVWSALAGIFLVAGYFTIVFRLWQGAGWHHSKSRWRPWLGGIMVGAPAYSVIPFALVCLTWRINLVEESFLFFARHIWLMILALLVLIAVVQPLSERNIRKLEFEFS